MRVFDTNDDGTLGMDEFCVLFQKLKIWNEAYRAVGAASIDGMPTAGEVTALLPALGYDLPPPAVGWMLQHLGDRVRTSGAAGVAFPDFVRTLAEIEAVHRIVSSTARGATVVSLRRAELNDFFWYCRG